MTVELRKCNIKQCSKRTSQLSLSTGAGLKWATPEEKEKEEKELS